MCRRTEEEVGPTVRLPCQTFLMVLQCTRPSTDTGPPFLGFSEKPSNLSRLLRCTWVYGGSISPFHPRVPKGFLHFKIKFWNHLFIYQNAYLKFLILCCMFKIDLYSRSLWCIQTCDVFYLYSITCKYLCDILSEVCFTFIYGINAWILWLGCTKMKCRCVLSIIW